MISIPLFYYPMKLLFVDDDENILITYSRLQIPNKISTAVIPVSISDDPFKILSDKISTSEEIIGESSNIILNKCLNFNKINELMMSKEKYDILGTVISDYQMPEINGIEYLKSVKVNVNKILLTGVFTSEEANEAYAKNLIDYYIRKDSQLEKVKAAIKMVETRFFIHLSQSVIQPERLVNNNFIQIFNQICGDAKEYWIINEYGGYKFIDNNGNTKTLNIYSQNDLNMLSEILGTRFSKYTLPNPYNMQESTSGATQTNEYYFNILEG